MNRNKKYFVLKGTDSPYLTVLKYRSPKQYEVLLYVRDHPDQTYGEVAKLLNIPTGTVKTRLHRARLKILEWRTVDLLRQNLNDIEAP